MSCPVLLVHGEKDGRVPLADVRHIYTNRSNERVELLLLPDTGHDSREAISTYGESLLAFLQRTAGGSSESVGHNQRIT